MNRNQVREREDGKASAAATSAAISIARFRVPTRLTPPEDQQRNEYEIADGVPNPPGERDCGGIASGGQSGWR